MHRPVALSLLLSLPTAALASRVEVPRAELCELASLVVVGEVTGQEVQWGEGSQGMLHTVSDLAVQRTLMGDPIDDLRVITRGGALQGLTQHVEDAALLRPDRLYLLMLAPIDGGGWRVVGGEDGVVLLSWEADLAPVLETLGGCLAR